MFRIPPPLGRGEFIQVIWEGFPVVEVQKEENRKGKREKGRKRIKRLKREEKEINGEKKRKNGNFFKMNGTIYIRGKNFKTIFGIKKNFVYSKWPEKRMFLKEKETNNNPKGMI